MQRRSSNRYFRR